MTYHLDRGRRGGKKIWWIAGLFFFMLVFFWPSIKPFIYKGIEPLTKRSFELLGGVYIVPEFIRIYFSSRETLREESRLLKSEIETLENKTAEQESALRELSELLGGSSTSSVRYGVPVVASSLAQDITKVYSSIILSKGYGDGIGVGDKVYLRKRQVICHIKEVYARTSLCELYSGFGNSVLGVTASSSVNITLEGRGGHYIANILRDTTVTVGEKILLKEDQSFVIGEVAEIFNNDQDTSWHILIRGEYNPVSSSLYYVETSTE